MTDIQLKVKTTTTSFTVTADPFTRFTVRWLMRIATMFAWASDMLISLVLWLIGVEYD